MKVTRLEVSYYIILSQSLLISSLNKNSFKWQQEKIDIFYRFEINGNLYLISLYHIGIFYGNKYTIFNNQSNKFSLFIFSL